MARNLNLCGRLWLAGAGIESGARLRVERSGWRPRLGAALPRPRRGSDRDSESVAKSSGGDSL